MTPKDKVQDMLSQMSADQQAIAQTLALNKIEIEQLSNRCAVLQRDYDELWKIVIVVLNQCDDRELRIHDSHLMAFKDEYRVESRHDDESGELVLKLKALSDE